MKNRAFDHRHYAEWRKPEDLIPYEKNAKIHDEKQIRNLVTSLKRFGWQQDCVITSDNVLVIGHGRRMAAMRIGCEIPVHVIDKKAEDLTDEDIRELRIADNQTNAETGFDFQLLAEDLEGLNFDGFDFDFQLPEDEGDPVIVTDDEYDKPLPDTPTCKHGQIWQLGKHRLMCGDSTDAGAWALLMDGKKADMVFTDPPYGVAIGDKNDILKDFNMKNGRNSKRITENIEGDTMSESQLYDMLKTAFVNVRENCAEDACYYVTSPQGGRLGLMMMMMKDAGLEVRHVLMWKKSRATFSLGRLDYDYQHEPIFYTWTKSHHNYRRGENRTTIWEYDKPRKCNLHPTMKPVELVANAILDGTKKGDIVLDAFGGSGTTMIACEETGRTCFMMELDPKYADVIIDRWETFTGGKVVLLNG